MPVARRDDGRVCGIETRQQRLQVGSGDEGHVGQHDERRRGGPTRRFGNAERERARQSGGFVGIDDDLETERREMAREQAIGRRTDGDPASRCQIGDPRGGVEDHRHPRQRCEQLVRITETPRTARRQQERANIPRLDHCRRSFAFRCHGPPVTMIAATPIDILGFALARVDEGVGAVIVTLTGIEGSSPRAIGAQMAVGADGRHLGSFSGGCIEAAVVAEAIAALADGRPRLVRFGAGSPYLDIRLPCGGGIDLLFNPVAERGAIAALLARHARRQPAALRFSLAGVEQVADNAPPATGWQGDDFHVAYAPALHIVALGQGEELTAFARLAAAYGAGITAMSPDAASLAALAADGFDAAFLHTRTRLPPLASDRWTAILFLFHDRDWEEYLLPHALGAPAFYVGAIGSRRTQQRRLAALERAGVPAAHRERLRTTVGLIPATRDPATLALSALAQIAEEYRLVEQGMWPGLGDLFASADQAIRPAGL